MNVCYYYTKTDHNYAPYRVQRSVFPGFSMHLQVAYLLYVVSKKISTSDCALHIFSKCKLICDPINVKLINFMPKS